MGRFRITEWTQPAGGAAVTAGAWFEVVLQLKDKRRKGGRCAVSLSVSPAVCTVEPRTASVTIPPGRDPAPLTVKVKLTGPPGTDCTLTAEAAGSRARRAVMLKAPSL